MSKTPRVEEIDQKLLGLEEIQKIAKKKKNRELILKNIRSKSPIDNAVTPFTLSIADNPKTKASGNIISFRGSVLKQESLLLKVYMSQFKKAKSKSRRDQSH